MSDADIVDELLRSYWNSLSGGGIPLSPALMRELDSRIADKIRAEEARGRRGIPA